MGCVLALYDCRSKQEYIYRTNRMVEISGGSALLAELFGGFFLNTDNYKFNIKTNWRGNINVSGDFVKDFEESNLDGELLYEGGGNLFVIYRNREIYLEINKALSRYAIDKTYSVSIVASCVNVTGDFNEDRKRLYAENTLRKNQGMFLVPNNVLPFTQTDRQTFMPIVKKDSRYGKELQLTMESSLKRGGGNAGNKGENLLDNMTDNNNSLLAVIYIDGNAMGDKLKNLSQNIKTYAEGISALRQFSCNTNEAFVDAPIREIEKYLSGKRNSGSEKANRYLYRKVISGGDEITLVCNAHIVREILDVYFSTLAKFKDSSACAGVAIFHSHTPFSEVYKIAEACCESGKEQAHNPENKGKSYIDFHYCHSGITNDLDALRKEQGILTIPYEVGESWSVFEKFADEIRPIGRRRIKNLGMAAFSGASSYRAELALVRSRFPEVNIPDIGEDFEKVMRMVSDLASVWDIWFDGGEE